MEFAAQLQTWRPAVIPRGGWSGPRWDRTPRGGTGTRRPFLHCTGGNLGQTSKPRRLPGLEILEIRNATPVQTYFDETILRYSYHKGAKQADEAIGLITPLHFGPTAHLSLKVKISMVTSGTSC